MVQDDPAKSIRERRLRKRDWILDTARKLINGDRAHTYGDAREDFSRTAKLWEPILGVKASPWQVALCLAMVKVSRLVATSGAHEDSWVDGCGYLALGGEIGIPVKDVFE